MYRAVEFDDPSAPTELKFWPRVQYTHPSLEYPIWESLGADFLNGGYGAAYQMGSWRKNVENPYDGWKLLDVSPSYFDGTGLEEGDVVYNPTQEYDGVPFTSLDPITGPVIDYDLLGFHRIDLIAFDNTFITGRKTAGTWIDFQKTPDSGRVINVGSASASRLYGKDEEVLKTLTGNMIDFLLIVQGDFDADDQLTPADIDLLTQEARSDEPRIRYDLTEDGEVTSEDLDRWLADFAGTWYGDANLDGDVTFADFVALSGSFGGLGSWGQGDFTGDGKVQFRDFVILARNFSRTQDDTELVPEPNTLTALLWCGLVTMAILRRGFTQ